MELESCTVDSSPQTVTSAISHAGYSHSDVKVARVIHSPGRRRVLLVEDEADLASFLAGELGDHHFAVDVVNGPEPAMEALRGRVWYDLLIVDLNSPPLDGASMVQRLRSSHPRLPMMVLTASNGVEEKVRAFECGSDDCIGKPFSVSELLARARALLRRNSGAIPNCSQVGDLTLHREERRVERSGRRIDLTPREFAILEVMMRNAGRPVSRETLLNEVWNLPGQPSTNIVDVYMKYVRDKVDLPGERRLTHTVRGFGYELREA